MGDDVTLRGTGPGGATQPGGADTNAEGGVAASRTAASVHYALGREVARGGMGRVLAADDLRIGRPVAIKELLSRSPILTRRFEREAKVTACLQHPGIVPIYEIGEWPDGTPFYAMRMVEGKTLRDALAGRATVEERLQLLPALIAAVDAVAFAHSKGVIHRDLSPGNVLVGDYGETVVIDWGLAKHLDDADEPSFHEAEDSAGEGLTVMGAVIGTPAYMPPEQAMGEPVDTRADVYTLGALLYHLLSGGPPYVGTNLEEILLEVREHGPRPIGEVAPDAPRDLRSIVGKAMARDRAERYPHAGALVEELRRFRTGVVVHAHRYSIRERIRRWARRRRGALIGSAAGIVGALAATGLVLALTSRDTVDPGALCADASTGMADVWDQGTRDAVLESFIATNHPTSTTSFGRVARAIDTYRDSWTKASVESCEATRVRKLQTDEVFALRTGCLDRRREELRALIRVLGDADRPLVDKGELLVLELDPVGSCSNVATLRDVGAPAIRDQEVSAVVKQFADARAQVITGRYISAIIAAKHAEDAAHKAGWTSIEADALLIRGTSLFQTGRFQESFDVTVAATWAGVAARRDDVVVVAAMTAAMVMANGLGKPAEARYWLELGEATAKRLESDPMIELRHQQFKSMVQVATGDWSGALVSQEKALKAGKVMYGDGNPAMYGLEALYGMGLTKAFKHRQAVGHLEAAVALREKMVGPDHTDLAATLSVLGVSRARLRDSQKAHAAFDRALAIREKGYGPNSFIVASTLDDMSELDRQEGHHADALAEIERATRLTEVLPGKDHYMWRQIAVDHAKVLLAAGRTADAQAVLDDVLAREAKSPTPALPEARRVRAELALVEHAWSDAESFAQQAIADYEAVGGPNNSELYVPLSVLAKARRELGKRAEALQAIDRALAIANTLELAAEDMTELREIRASL